MNKNKLKNEYCQKIKLKTADSASKIYETSYYKTGLKKMQSASKSTY
jgi:hypothetical protein